MIIALDTWGNIYLSLTQCNTNNQIMSIFFRNLVLKLDQQDPHWRNDTVITLDNAPYHSTPSTMAMFENLRIPILFTGPHSYDFAPCENVFAWFKSEDFNPLRLPLGKK